MPDDILGHAPFTVKPNPDLLFYDMFTGQKNFCLAICASILAGGDSFSVNSAIETAQEILDKIAKKEGK